MTTTPAPAEAARSLLAGGTTLELSTDGHGRFLAMGGHVVDDRGALLLSVPSGSRLAAHLQEHEDVRARAEVVDTAPVSVRERVRGRLVLLGWASALPRPEAERAWAAAGERSVLDAGGTLLRLDPAAVALEVDGTWCDLEPEEWAAAEPDPLARHEAEVLQHLASGHHPDELAALVALLPPGLREGSCRVVPLRLHRRAVVLRVEVADGHHDVALALPRRRRAPLPSSPEDVLRGLRQLLGPCCGDARAC